MLASRWQTPPIFLPYRRLRARRFLGPAARAGIRPGDVLTSVAGNEVHNVAELLTRVAGLKPGVASRFSLQRQDNQLELDVVPGLRPKPRRPS